MSQKNNFPLDKNGKMLFVGDKVKVRGFEFTVVSINPFFDGFEAKIERAVEDTDRTEKIIFITTFLDKV